jgi:hypothetical protein
MTSPDGTISARSGALISYAGQTQPKLVRALGRKFGHDSLDKHYLRCMALRCAGDGGPSIGAIDLGDQDYYDFSHDCNRAGQRQND